MTEQSTRPAGGRTRSGWRVVGVIGLVALVAGLVYGGASGFCFRVGDETKTPSPPPKEPTVGAIPLFAGWPKDVKPDAAIVLSGETFGFVQPCGCSRPQMGGLERRANFFNSLRAKGWPVIGLDLGDVYPARHPTGPSGIVAPDEQSLLKYVAAMNALREMGYVAVGVGKTEFTVGLHKLVAEYALQKDQPPYTLAGNVVGVSDGKPVPREAFFPSGGTRPTVGLAEVALGGTVPVGVVGVVGPTVAKEAVKADHSIDFEGNKKILEDAAAALANHPKKPRVNVLLYQGSLDEAKKVAAAWPQYRVVLCQGDDPEPPQFPTTVNHPDGGQTMLIQVGHKGRYVGVVGVFNGPGGKVDLKYQLVPLGEDYVTPDNPAAEKGNKALPVLEAYAKQVKDRNLLARISQLPHPAQIQAPKLNLTYIGSEKCMGCHAAEFVKWQGTPHSHALDALEKVAKRPGLRNFDAECVVCHTIGFGYKTGYENAEKTPSLKHVGCESCHGPGSGHAAAPKNDQLLKLMAPWKQAKADKLPDTATMERISKLNPADRGQEVIPPAQQRVINGVSQACMKCHDGENDPHFDLFKYWPKVTHSGLAAGGRPPLPGK
ncbi:MAG: cycA1 [Gemmataceae bacterium]|nr:cycA1 [Gemmataceae bacterium]